ncbi:cytochrome c3 family protein, partial [Bradyrhizobium sp. SZCCHNS3053]|uniref:cytochrome c3 family protein n=1 Tax=Bradyrhizobium sp. SZCCHNS3053 TaxID=3057322 RepID=UPI002916E6CD
VSTARCDSCHNGSYTGQGTKGAMGTASYPNHVATGGTDCVSCHAKAASGGFTSWGGAAFKHAATDTNCATCHNGKTAQGMTTPPHIPTGTLQCSNCHTNTAASFATYTMNHAAVSTARCDSCHNGSFTGQGTKGAMGTASYPNHVATGGADCVSCHAKAASGGFTSWGGAAFKHAATDTNCATCHNGKTAMGMTTPPHIPTGTLQCSNCHSNTAASFATYTMNHAAVSTARCDSCHNGSYTGQGTKGAMGTASYPNHVATGGADCVSCHAKAASGGFTSWGGGAFAHKATDTNCTTCHNGKTAQGMTTPPHIPTGTLQCSNCHSNTAASFATYTMNHAAVSTARCDSCHNGSYTGQGTKGAMGTASYPNHVATGGADCVSCHAKAASGGFTSWGGGAFAHKATDTNCATCHNGKTAQGMTTPPHIPTGTLQCSNCHSNTAASFATYTMNHAAVATARCDSCHNGSYTGQGTKGAMGTASYPNHVATGGTDCVSCHAKAASGGFTSWGGGAFAHKATDTNCATCHNGKTAMGMTTPPHIPTGTLQCSNCHSNTAASFATYTMNHAAVATARCDSCHNGSYTGQGTKGAMGTASYPNHVATGGADCVSCHAKAASGGFTSWGGGAFAHKATDTNCATCHNGKTAMGMTTPPHIPTGTLQCSNCHTNTAAS